MAITAKMVKELRERTNVGMMDCKKALTAAEGDMEKAIEILREKGLAKAAKKSGRIAAEGLVYTSVSEDNKTASIVEVNSETDFVAKNKDFQEYVSNVAKQALKTNATDLEGFMAEPWVEDGSKSVHDSLIEKITVIGENLSIRRFEKVVADNGAVVSYIHGAGRIGVLVKLICSEVNDKVIEVGKNMAMQIAAMNPKYVSEENIPSEYIEKEKEILKQQALNEGKPEKIVEKMVVGRLKKSLKEVCLLDEAFIKDDELTVQKYLKNVSKEAGFDITIESFVRFETGEGIEKKQENFAEEVAKQMGN